MHSFSCTHLPDDLCGPCPREIVKGYLAASHSVQFVVATGSCEKKAVVIIVGHYIIEMHDFIFIGSALNGFSGSC